MGGVRPKSTFKNYIPDDLLVLQKFVFQEVKQAPVPVSSISKELSPEDLSALKNAIEAITKEKGKSFLQEHEVLLDLKQELTDYEEDLGGFISPPPRLYRNSYLIIYRLVRLN